MGKLFCSRRGRTLAEFRLNNNTSLTTINLPSLPNPPFASTPRRFLLSAEITVSIPILICLFAERIRRSFLRIARTLGDPSPGLVSRTSMVALGVFVRVSLSAVSAVDQFTISNFFQSPLREDSV